MNGKTHPNLCCSGKRPLQIVGAPGQHDAASQALKMPGLVPAEGGSRPCPLEFSGSGFKMEAFPGRTPDTLRRSGGEGGCLLHFSVTLGTAWVPCRTFWGSWDLGPLVLEAATPWGQSDSVRAAPTCLKMLPQGFSSPASPHPPTTTHGPPQPSPTSFSHTPRRSHGSAHVKAAEEGETLNSTW